jgi:dihydropteroate synthase
MQPELVGFSTPGQARIAFEATGVESEGARRLADKAFVRPILIKGIKGGAANLLKQEMLARGGDASAPSVIVMHPETLVDTYLLGTIQDYRSLIRWLKATPLFGFPALAEQLTALLAEDLSD